jgi:hypothetical protein
MKRTPPTTKSIKSTKVAKPASRKVSAAAKKTPAKKAPPAPKPPAVSSTKQSQLITLLGSSGATLAQMMSLTGWQAHTVRGMISGSLRKRLGLNVQTQVEEGVRVYRIVEEGAQ